MEIKKLIKPYRDWPFMKIGNNSKHICLRKNEKNEQFPPLFVHQLIKDGRGGGSLD
jgi:hypothetical protein